MYAGQPLTYAMGNLGIFYLRESLCRRDEVLSAPRISSESVVFHLVSGCLLSFRVGLVFCVLGLVFVSAI